MVASDEKDARKEHHRANKKPSERTALFILSVVDWFRDIIGSKAELPHGQAFQHCGKDMLPGKTLRYPSILIVEDNPGIAAGFTEVIRKYYTYGTVQILVAHTYASAVTFFENEAVELVIMDADLEDQNGDGATLTLKFLGARPEITILANSSSKIYNLKLTGSGARETLGKNPEKLKNWLQTHDPAGEGG